MNRDVIAHYDRLIELDNDPARDPEPLRNYMDGWDGEAFTERLGLNASQSVLEIGAGTGRLALRIAPGCGWYTGIDLSPGTIVRAKENLAKWQNVTLICADFLEYEFSARYDVICSSLTFMHIARKREAIEKIASLLAPGGRTVISIDKNRSQFIDAGFGPLKIWPDDPAELEGYFCECGMDTEPRRETRFAWILSAAKK